MSKTTFERDDLVKIQAWPDTEWRVLYVTPVLDATRGDHVRVSLVDTANPNRGTAFREEDLATELLAHRRPDADRAELIERLTADLLEHPAFFPGVNPARPLATVLIDKGWRLP